MKLQMQKIWSYLNKILRNSYNVWKIGGTFSLHICVYHSRCKQAERIDT